MASSGVGLWVAHLPIYGIRPVFTPQLWEVLQATLPASALVLPAPRIELLVLVLTGLKIYQVILCTSITASGAHYLQKACASSTHLIPVVVVALGLSLLAVDLVAERWKMRSALLLGRCAYLYRKLPTRRGVGDQEPERGSDEHQHNDLQQALHRGPAHTPADSYMGILSAFSKRDSAAQVKRYLKNAYETLCWNSNMRQV